MRNGRPYSLTRAIQIGNAIGIDWRQFSVNQFRKGLLVEGQDSASKPQITVDYPEALATGKIVLAHLKDYSRYYTRLARIEKEADEYWADV